jgi:hypothetical protein
MSKAAALARGEPRTLGRCSRPVAAWRPVCAPEAGRGSVAPLCWVEPLCLRARTTRSRFRALQAEGGRR